MPRRLTLIATSVALVVTLVACGGDDDDSADERDTTTTEEASSTTQAEEETDGSTTSEEPTTEATEPSDTTDAPDEPGGDDTITTISIPEGADFCTAYGSFDESAENLPNDTVEGLQAASEALRQAISELAPLAPEELAGAMDLLVQATEQLVDLTADATTVEDAQGALTEVFSDQEFAGAAQEIDTWFGENCAEANDDQADAEAPETVTPG